MVTVSNDTEVPILIKLEFRYQGEIYCCYGRAQWSRWHPGLEQYISVDDVPLAVMKAAKKIHGSYTVSEREPRV